MNIGIFLILSILSILSNSSFGSTVVFYFFDSGANPITSTKCIISPQSSPQVVGSGLSSAGYLQFVTDQNGSGTITNMVTGTYSVRLLTTPNTFFQILVPNDGVTYYATNLITQIIAPNSAAGWSRAASDARYIEVSNTAPTGYTLILTNGEWTPQPVSALSTNIAYMRIGQQAIAGSLTVNGSGNITAVAIPFGGYAYTTAPTLNITTTGGTGAQITGTLNGLGVVTGVNIADAGAGYSGSDTASFPPPPTMIIGPEIFDGPVIITNNAAGTATNVFAGTFIGVQNGSVTLSNLVNAWTMNAAGQLTNSSVTVTNAGGSVVINPTNGTVTASGPITATGDVLSYVPLGDPYLELKSGDTTTPDWIWAASGEGGYIYLWDRKDNLFPFNVEQNTPNTSLVLGPSGNTNGQNVYFQAGITGGAAWWTNVSTLYMTNSTLLSSNTSGESILTPSQLELFTGTSYVSLSGVGINLDGQIIMQPNYITIPNTMLATENAGVLLLGETTNSGPLLLEGTVTNNSWSAGNILAVGTGGSVAPASYGSVTNGVNASLISASNVLYADITSAGSFTESDLIPLTNFAGVLSTNATNFAKGVGLAASNLFQAGSTTLSNFSAYCTVDDDGSLLISQSTTGTIVGDGGLTNYGPTLLSGSVYFGSYAFFPAILFANSVQATNNITVAGGASIAGPITNGALSAGELVITGPSQPYLASMTFGAFSNPLVASFGILSTNGTNFAQLVGTTLTNWAGILSTNATNYANSIVPGGFNGNPLTNLLGVLSTNATNFAGTLSTNATNFTGTLSTNATNYVQGYAQPVNANLTQFAASATLPSGSLITNPVIVAPSSGPYIRYDVGGNLWITNTSGPALGPMTEYLSGGTSIRDYVGRLIQSSNNSSFPFQIAPVGNGTYESMNFLNYPTNFADALTFKGTNGDYEGEIGGADASAIFGRPRETFLWTSSSYSPNMMTRNIVAAPASGSVTITLPSTLKSAGTSSGDSWRNTGMIFGGNNSLHFAVSHFGASGTTVALSCNSQTFYLPDGTTSTAPQVPFGATWDCASDGTNIYVRGPTGFAGGTDMAVSQSAGVTTYSFSPTTGGMTIAPNAPSTTLDWSASNTQSNYLSSSSSFNMVNTTSGQPFTVSVTDAASYTITWGVPAGQTLKWPGGTQPMQTASHTDVYTFVRIGNTVYGSAVQNF